MIRRLAPAAAALVALALAAPASAATRDLDLSFGGDGMVMTPIGIDNAAASAVARQPDGRIVAAGSATTTARGGYPNPALAIARYLPNGALDGSFALDGIVLDSHGAEGSGAEAVVVQPDGKILVSGRRGACCLTIPFVARYLPNGHRDETFGDGGLRLLPDYGDRGNAPGLALQSDGRIVVAGDYETGGTLQDDGVRNAYVAQLTAEGDLDPSYGSGGVTRVPTAAGFTRTGGLVLQDGKAVIAGSILDADVAEWDVMLARFDGDGALDGTFGDGGIVSDRAGNDEDYLADDVALWNGKLLVAGFRGPTPGDARNYLLARFDADDGALDTSFNAEGTDPGHVFAGAGEDGARAAALAVDPVSGSVTLTGGAFKDLHGRAMVVRYTSDGLRDDAGFRSANGNVGPRLLGPDDGGEAFGLDLLLDAAGKIVMAGSALDCGHYGFFLARLGDTPPRPNARPVARIRGQHRLPRRTWVRFDGLRSSDPDGRIVDYAWRVDGRPFRSIGSVFWHRFRRGVHRVDLRVTDDDGARGYAKFYVRAFRRGG